MAHGLPDWYRGVDIAYQALAQMIVRPTYGGAIESQGNQVVTASATTTLVTISGKGMIYGGHGRTQYTSTQMDSGLRLELDGNLVFYEPFRDLDTYGATSARAYPVIISKYDNAGFYYAASLAYGLTFESELVLKYVENHGTTPNIYYSIVYALV